MMGKIEILYFGNARQKKTIFMTGTVEQAKAKADEIFSAKEAGMMVIVRDGVFGADLAKRRGNSRIWTACC
jgi:hypothetical protein